MTWPNATISTTNLDNAADSPANARADLYDAVVAVNSMINSRGTANGVASLDSSAYINQGQINPNITSSGGLDVTISPGSERVNIDNILNLEPQSVSQLSNVSAQTGDISYCSDGASGNVCLAVYTGAAWKQVALGSNISAT